MASRGADGTLKLWDLRAFKKPLAVWEGLDTNYANTNCCFSPDERLLLTGRHLCVYTSLVHTSTANCNACSTVCTCSASRICHWQLAAQPLHTNLSFVICCCKVSAAAAAVTHDVWHDGGVSCCCCCRHCCRAPSPSCWCW